MLHDEKPALDEDLLEHFGVKGMHWGVRKAKTGGQIRTARRSVAKSRMHVQDVRELVKAGKASEHALAKAKLDHLKNPDRATAARMTRGEHVAAALLLSPIGAAGLMAGVQVRSRVIDAKQVSGDYKIKKK